MAFRVKEHFVLVVTFLLLACGCGMGPQQQRFQNAFLPPPPHKAADIATSEPPAVPSNLYLSDVPNVVSGAPQLPGAATHADLLIEKAQQHFQQGKKYYQIKDVDQARNEFNQAVDLMLDASDNPSDRRVYEAKLEEMVEAIHG